MHSVCGAQQRKGEVITKKKGYFIGVNQAKDLDEEDDDAPNLEGPADDAAGLVC
jgi:hypothetical protein